MLIFIDESGIHKKVDHSTFALAYIAVENYETLERDVQGIEKKLGIESFHWSETVWKVKEIFFQAVINLDFTLKVAIVKNPIHPEEELERLLPHLLVEHNIGTVFIDGTKPKWYERKVKKILRDHGILVRKLKTVKDSQYAGIRVADMAAGLIRSYFDKPNNKKVGRLYKKLEKKIIVEVH